MMYADRRAAGAVLATHLDRYAGRTDVVVLGLPRGGVPVAAVVAARLGCRLDALMIRKLVVPWTPGVAFGAVGPLGVLVLNQEVAGRLDPAARRAVVDRERTEIDRRQRRYRLGRPPLDLTDRTAVVVDDGLATGCTARAAVAVVRAMRAAVVVFAVPAGCPRAVAALEPLVDVVVCPLAPEPFGAVSRYYDDFSQIGDAEVIQRLASAAGP